MRESRYSLGGYPSFERFSGLVEPVGAYIASLRYCGRDVLTPIYLDRQKKIRGGSFVCADVFGPNADSKGNHGVMRNQIWFPSIEQPNVGMRMESVNPENGLLYILTRSEQDVNGDTSRFETNIFVSNIGQHEGSARILLAPAEHPYTTVQYDTYQPALENIGITPESLEAGPVLHTLEPDEDMVLLANELELRFSSDGSLNVFCFWVGPRGELCVEPTSAGPVRINGKENDEDLYIQPAETRSYRWFLDVSQR